MVARHITLRNSLLQRRCWRGGQMGSKISLRTIFTPRSCMGLGCQDSLILLRVRDSVPLGQTHFLRRGCLAKVPLESCSSGWDRKSSFYRQTDTPHQALTLRIELEVFMLSYWVNQRRLSSMLLRGLIMRQSKPMYAHRRSHTGL